MDASLRLEGGAATCRPTPAEAACHDLQHFAHGGVLVRPDLDSGRLGIRVLHERLEFGLFLGGARMRSFGAGGAIQLPAALPATLAAARPGRPPEALVAHPLVEGAGCVVTGVDEPMRWRTNAHFRLAPTPWRLRWGRG